MKRFLWIPLTALTGGLAALGLRIWNLQDGFEPGNGLPVAGHPSFTAMLIVLAGTLAALILLARRLPARDGPRFPFRTDDRLFRILCAAGALALALSGCADLFESFSGENLRSLLGGPATRYEYAFSHIIGAGESVGMSAGVQCAAGLLAVLSARAVLLCASACARGKSFSRLWIPVPAVALSFRLVTMYRVDSVNPVMEEYGPVLVALVFQTLGFYDFSAFAFECGNLRKFAVSTGGALSMALCVVLDKGDYLSTPLVLFGSASALTAFLLAAFQAPPSPPDSPAAEPGKIER